MEKISSALRRLARQATAEGDLHNAALFDSAADYIDNMENRLDNHAVARVTHEANRALCSAFGDSSRVPWKDAPVWERQAAPSLGFLPVSASKRYTPRATRGLGCQQVRGRIGPTAPFGTSH